MLFITVKNLVFLLISFLKCFIKCGTYLIKSRERKQTKDSITGQLNKLSTKVYAFIS